MWRTQQKVPHFKNPPLPHMKNLPPTCSSLPVAAEEPLAPSGTGSAGGG